jgi:uncharacterized membrane-anchored protein
MDYCESLVKELKREIIGCIVCSFCYCSTIFVLQLTAYFFTNATVQQFALSVRKTKVYEKQIRYWLAIVTINRLQ